MNRSVIVAGGRDFTDYQIAEKRLVELLILPNKYARIEIVSGCARGADAIGERFAKDYMLAVKKFPADWESHGKSAGPIRNIQMAKHAHALVAFWDGKSRGTKNMIDVALAARLETHVFFYGSQP